jgi:XTP/dITP diphosphohydrolase
VHDRVHWLGPTVTKVVIASQNPDKIAEMDDLLSSLGFEIVRGLVWAEVEETEPTLEGNALLKAHAVARATGHIAIADDTGLEVEALGGAPGVMTARYAGENATYDENVSALLMALDGEANRAAQFRTAVAMVGPNLDDLTVSGHVDGRIALERRGLSGFGYDPIFEVDGQTFAEMDGDEKHKISHRGLALRALVKVLSGR